ncbi:ribonuclease P/MRP protein subunit POP1 SCDLUD_003023 [Saccharomycodes ludwigii]|uniref:ribonuclease P/MRP protein subunit POP1 n=1 Tax=Saccharomycodes ludwigii TaxID=36035 RepID=UPI001E86D92A|nr:hypothetical protein SCDLUD_003023 [Saccharomycodes ludwigii]KAH3901527.1 hypothetical protein SCDLUD_003023 [Saccharomycodes ludwigii]
MSANNVNTSSSYNSSNHKNNPRRKFNENQQKKFQRVRNARTIRTEIIQDIRQTRRQRNNNANVFSEDAGVLKLPEFISSREFEIKQLQNAMHNSKKSSSTRVFQDLPRKLRRRTASHNVKRIPKRLRKRALNEMKKSSQSITTGNTHLLKDKPHYTKKQLYKLKMSVKLLRLATKSKHMRYSINYETKNFKKYQLRRKFRDLKKLVNMHKNLKDGKITSIKNSVFSFKNAEEISTPHANQLAPLPLAKSIKYMKRQKKYAWLPTHVWNSKRSHMIKVWGKNIAYTPTQKCFRLTHRLGNANSCLSDGCLMEDSCYRGKMVVSSNNCTESNLPKLLSQIIKNKNKIVIDGKVLGPVDLYWIEKPSKLLLILHPSIYATVFNYIASKFTEYLCVTDFQYNIGSIDLFGATVLQTLAKVLRREFDIVNIEHRSSSLNDDYQLFMQLASNVRDINALPISKDFNLGFIVKDPRSLKRPQLPKDFNNKVFNFDEVIQLLENRDSNSDVWKNLFTMEGKHHTDILRFPSKSTTKGSESTQSGNTDNSNSAVSIPLIITKTTLGWRVLLPYHWVLPLWNKLNKVPRTYHIGLKQEQQLHYEQNKLYFPHDWPFTPMGYQLNCNEAAAKKEVWERKPFSKKINYQKIDSIHEEELPYCGEIGDWFCCDWKLLQFLHNGINYYLSSNNCSGNNNALTAIDIPIVNAAKTTQFDNQNIRNITCIVDIFELYKETHTAVDVPIELFNVKNGTENNLNLLQKHDIVTKRLPIIPIKFEAIDRGHPLDNARIYAISRSKWEDYWQLIVSKSLKTPSGKTDHESYKEMLSSKYLPKIQDLVGFVTCGTFNLSSGKGTCIGMVVPQELLKYDYSSSHYLIRNTGTNSYRIFKSSPIKI